MNKPPKPVPFQIFLPNYGVSYSEDGDPVWIVLVHAADDPDPYGINLGLANGPTAELVTRYTSAALGKDVTVLGCFAIRQLFSELGEHGADEAVIDNGGPIL